MTDEPFTLRDFIRQMDNVRKPGQINQIMAGIPGMKEAGFDSAMVEAHMLRMYGIYHAMTDMERSDPGVINDNRRLRIARGAGVQFAEVGNFLKQFAQTRDMMRALRRFKPRF